jgi:uncharacterized Zn-binding protein involved in type VI secretion
MRRVIRLGDRTSHGGYVVAATSHFTVMGMDVARLGDKCTCPKKGHNNCYIVEGDPDWTIDGIPVALEGHKLSCGAVLISSMPNAGRDDWGGSSSSSSLQPAVSSVSKTEEIAHDIHFLVEDESTGRPLANIPYKITLENGKSVEGKTDERGLTEKISDTSSTIASLEAPYYGNTNSGHETCGC